MGLIDLVRDINFANQVNSVPVVVTLPNEDPTDTRGIWITTTSEDAPAGEFSRREPRRIMALRRDVLPTVPRGTLIVGPEMPGGVDKAWRVDGHERQEADHHRVVVMLDVAATADLPVPE